MRVCWLILILLATNFITFGQTRKENPQIAVLELSGKVTKIQINENLSEYWTQLIVSIDVTLTNIGTVPIILLNKENMVCQSAEMAKTKQALNEKDSSYSQYSITQSSFGFTEEQWLENKARLDKDAPPQDLTFILNTSSSRTIIHNLYLHLEKGQLNSENSLAQVKSLSPNYLRLSNCHFRNYGTYVGKRLKFAEKLQKRWNRHGTLWLYETQTQPIYFDLGAEPK